MLQNCRVHERLGRVFACSDVPSRVTAIDSSKSTRSERSLIATRFAILLIGLYRVAKSRLLVVLAFFVLAIWTTWPLVRCASSAVPVGIVQVTTVPLFNTWTIWWNSDRLLHRFQGYWTAPIFHPTVDTFAFSEPQPTTLIVAPIIWITGSRVLAYNFYLVLSLGLNGLFAARLLRVIGMRRSLTIVGGMSIIMLPLVHWQLDVVQLVPLWGILWTWTTCWQISRKPGWIRGAELGIAFSVAFLTSGHQGLFLGLLLVGSVGMLFQDGLRWKTWLPWLIASVLVALLVGPIILPMQRALSRQEFQRKPELVAQLSVHPSDYLTPQGKSIWDFGVSQDRPFWRLSPGWIKVTLALCAIVIGIQRKRWRRWTLFLMTNAVLAFLLSLGPHLWIGMWQPWWTVTHIVPGFSRVRNVFRFAFFVQLAIVILAVQGLHLLSVFNRRYCHHLRARICIRAILIALGFVAVFETQPDRVLLGTVPDFSSHQAWIEFVRTNTPTGKAIACFPFPSGDRVFELERNAQWMYAGTFHHVPLVNGYSGFFPPDYFELQNAINTEFPTDQILQKLYDSGVEFLVVDTTDIAVRKWQDTQFPHFKLIPVFQDSSGIHIYQLQAKL